MEEALPECRVTCDPTGEIDVIEIKVIGTEDEMSLFLKRADAGIKEV